MTEHRKAIVGVIVMIAAMGLLIHGLISNSASSPGLGGPVVLPATEHQISSSGANDKPQALRTIDPQPQRIDGDEVDDDAAVTGSSPDGQDDGGQRDDAPVTGSSPRGDQDDDGEVRDRDNGDDSEKGGEDDGDEGDDSGEGERDD